MWDTIQKLEYRVRANIEGAQQELNMRLTDRMNCLFMVCMVKSCI